jgi:uncharacterized protein with HEPN domain
MLRDIESLLDVLDATEKAMMFVAGKTEAEFNEDFECQFAVVRAIEIIGEAARRVSEEMVSSHPEIPWREMISMRNHIIHKYDHVDLEVVWDTVQNDIPRLASLIRPLVSRK